MTSYGTYGIKFDGGRFVKGRGSIFMDNYVEKCT